MPSPNPRTVKVQTSEGPMQVPVASFWRRLALKWGMYVEVGYRVLSIEKPTPGGNHIWVNTTIGRIRKPYVNA